MNIRRDHGMGLTLAALAALAGSVLATGCSETDVPISYDSGKTPLTRSASTRKFTHKPVIPAPQPAAANPLPIDPAMEATLGTPPPAPAPVPAPVPAPAPVIAAEPPKPAVTETPAAPPAQAPMATDNPSKDTPITANISRVTFAEEGADFDPCASRDGTHVVFASTQHRTTSDIFIKRTDSRVVTQLTNDPGQDAMPAISPDGTKIAFASDRAGNWDIYVMPITGGKAVQITSEQSDEIHPSWSPDSKQIVFSRMGQSSGRWEMWITDVQNPSVSNFIGYGLFPQWCPVAGTGEGGADRILYQLGRERGRRAFGLWTIDVANSSANNATEIASSGTTALINPTWSPDGRWIVYAEVPVAQSAGNTPAPAPTKATKPAWATLWMLSVEGEGKVRLTSGPGVALSPSWSGNNRLFFVCDRSGSDNVWSLDLNPAIVSAMATLGNQPAGNHTTAHATTPAPASDPHEAHKTDTVANVPEGEQPSNATPR